MGDRLVRDRLVRDRLPDRLPELNFQVGGHRTMKVYRDNYVCKPLDRREEKFYSTFPKILEPFIPKFAGVLTVGSSESQDEFIMLENLCTGYRKPCVLDLKMGTRMYGDFASEKKRKSQDIKTKGTTSSKLGVRLCGYQRYSKSSSCFQKVDKYVGRKVDVPKFQEMLQLFFTIGGELQRNVISSLLQQVRLMQRIVLDLEGFRFYSSSLLIVFEGDLAEIYEDEYEDDQVEDHGPSFYQKPPVVKIIDFANCTYPGFVKEDIIHEGPDSGFLFGLENLIEILNIIKQSEE